VSQTRDQKRFTIWEVAADWRELMMLLRIAPLLNNLPTVQHADLPPQRATLEFHPVARKLLPYRQDYIIF